MQRRVARPFARVTLLVENQPAAKLLTEPKKPNPSYVAVETCKNDKAAILTLFVRLPGDHETGLPSLGRTGLCLGSAVVHVNSNKKPKKGVRQRRRGEEEEEEQGERRGGGGGGGIRGASTSENTFLVHTTGRGRQRGLSPSAVTV